jgi:hypothetical protein
VALNGGEVVGVTLLVRAVSSLHRRFGLVPIPASAEALGN